MVDTLASIDMGLCAGVEDNYITGKLELTNFTFTIARTFIGPLPPPANEALEALLGFILGDVLIPFFNAHYKGVPLPSLPGVKLVNASIAEHPHELRIETGVEFS